MTKFGPSGNSKDFYDDGNTKSEQAFSWLNQKGLNAYEYSFGRGINIGDQKAALMQQQSSLYGVEISVHAPYYINLANPDDQMAQKSFNYLLDSCKKLSTLGGKRLIFHPATVGKQTRQDAFELCCKRIDNLLEQIYQQKLDDFYFCPETMGKINQIGDQREIALLCARDKCLLPAIDFGHLNARTMGGLKTVDDYKRVIDTLIDIVGEQKTRNMHIHFSKIEYSKGGEVKHLTFADNTFGPDFEPLAKVIVEYNLNPIIICESDGTQTQDAISMQQTLNGLLG